jgi:hypothetical protein
MEMSIGGPQFLLEPIERAANILHNIGAIEQGLAPAQP